MTPYEILSVIKHMHIREVKLNRDVEAEDVKIWIEEDGWGYTEASFQLNPAGITKYRYNMCS